jgi:hypothetical protein
METKHYQPRHRGEFTVITIRGRWHLTQRFVQLQDPNNNVIAFVRPTRPTRYQGLGDVYAELHFVRSAGAGVVVCPAVAISIHHNG